MLLWILMESGTMSDSSASIKESQESLLPQTPAYWVFLPGLAVSAYVLWMGPRGNNRELFGSALLVFVLALAGPLFRALQQRVLASVCALLVISSYWTVPFLFLFVYSVLALVFFWIFLLPLLVFAIAATISLARKLGGTYAIGSTWAFGTVGVGFLCGMIAASTLLQGKNKDLTWARGLDPIVLAPAILVIDKCSQEFAVSHPQTGYPESLEQLGPSGTGCLSAALLQGQIKGFTILYQPGAKDSDGKIGGYAVKGRETSPKGLDVSSIISDESGRIHFRSDGPHGMGSTIDYFPGQAAFSLLVDTLWAASLNSSFQIIDAHGNRLVRDRDEYVRTCLWEQRFTDKRQFTSGGLNFEYSFTSENNGTVNGFTVEVRPQQYGISGIRSYLAVATIDPHTSLHFFVIHVTPQDRSATLADPMTQPGEVKPSGYLSSEKPTTSLRGEESSPPPNPPPKSAHSP